MPSNSYGNIHGVMIYVNGDNGGTGKVNQLLQIPFYYYWQVGNDNDDRKLFCNSGQITNLVFIGAINAKDISANTDFVKLVSEKTGNYVGQGLPTEGQVSATANSGQMVGNVTRLDLTRAYFPVNNDMRIGQNFSKITECYLPIDYRQNTIPDSCFIGCNSLDSLCIPGNIKHIGDYAFNANGNKFSHVYTTDVDAAGNGYPNRANDWAYKANTDKIIDMWPEEDRDSYDENKAAFLNGCITLPAGLESIGHLAFNCIYYKNVYSLNPVAPTCAYNAFNSVSYNGNNSFTPTEGVACQENYFTGNGWMSMLHYPNDCSAEEEKNYTDVTRKYDIPDSNGDTDGEGKILRWPGQSNFNRALSQAVAGVTWNFWKDGSDGTDYLSDWQNTSATAAGFAGGSQNGLDWMRHEPWQGYDDLYKDYGVQLTASTGNGANTAKARGAKGTVSGTNDGATYYDWVKDTEAVYDTDYMGWHQFVLAATSATDDMPEGGNYIRKDWYTICVPTDLTRAEVLKYFGVPAGSTINGGKAVEDDTYPLVSTLYGVDRDMTKNLITLHFTDSLCSEKTWDFSQSAGTYYAIGDEPSSHYVSLSSDEDIAMYGGCPYLIRPYVHESLNVDGYKPATFLLSHKTTEHKTSLNENYTEYPKNDYYVNSRRIESDGTTQEMAQDGDEAYIYHFVSTYDTLTLPKYAYYIGTKNKKSYWFRLTSDKVWKWNPYVCIIGAMGNVELKDSTVQNIKGQLTYKYISYGSNLDDDLFSKTTGANIAANYLMAFGHDDDDLVITGIKEVDADVVEEASADEKVYTIGGQRVNAATLKRGIYIKNGKKFVVK